MRMRFTLAWPITPSATSRRAASVLAVCPSSMRTVAGSVRSPVCKALRVSVARWVLRGRRANKVLKASRAKQALKALRAIRDRKVCAVKPALKASEARSVPKAPKVIRGLKVCAVKRALKGPKATQALVVKPAHRASEV